MIISAHSESWPLKGSFSISRGSKTSVNVVVVEISDGSTRGVGEAVPYPRYNQGVEETLEIIQNIASRHGSELTRDLLRQQYPPNAARNALDCALWDFEAKRNATSAWKMAGLSKPVPVTGAYSLSLEPPEQLAKNAQDAVDFPLLKVKLGKDQVVESVAAVRDARPDARIILDANEAWDTNVLERVVPALKQLEVEMIEQPLPSEVDAALDGIESEIPLCADESFHNVNDLQKLTSRYEIFNIKLDKTGGLTEALILADRVLAEGKKVMVGSMMATSLGLAPAMLLTHRAAYVDLDSSVWLAEDRQNSIRFEGGILQPPNPNLWG